ncbi:MAG: hypothetical protein ACRDCI_11930 [Plesiomonas shigelloides]
MEEFIALSVFIGLLVMGIILPVLCGYVASQKGRNWFAWVCISLIVTPIIALVALAAIGDNKKAP